MINLDELDNLRLAILTPDFVEEASSFADYEPDELAQYFRTSLEEARLTLGLVDNVEMESLRVLEFGSGLGLASIVLHYNQVQIVSFEPGGLGFERNRLLSQFIKERFELDFELIDNIEELKTRTFDLIVSNNVLEHIPDLAETLSVLNDALSSDGRMIHNIPNYVFPYEPHFGIPFFPVFPTKMSFMIPKSITRTSLWKSLNFVNLFDIKRYARANQAEVTFEKGTLHRSLARILKDPEFGQRHQSISGVARLLDRARILSLFKYLPAALSTPMVFEWRKPV